MVSEMIAELSKRMSLFLCKKEIVEQEMAEVYQYGFEIIFSTLIGFFITIAIGAVFRMFLVSLVYYFAFVALRQFTGGYHANTYLKCNLISHEVLAGVNTAGNNHCRRLQRQVAVQRHGAALRL